MELMSLAHVRIQIDGTTHFFANGEPVTLTGDEARVLYSMLGAGLVKRPPGVDEELRRERDQLRQERNEMQIERDNARHDLKIEEESHLARLHAHYATREKRDKAAAEAKRMGEEVAKLTTELLGAQEAHGKERRIVESLRADIARRDADNVERCRELTAALGQYGIEGETFAVAIERLRDLYSGALGSISVLEGERERAEGKVEALRTRIVDIASNLQVKTDPGPGAPTTLGMLDAIERFAAPFAREAMTLPSLDRGARLAMTAEERAIEWQLEAQSLQKRLALTKASLESRTAELNEMTHERNDLREQLKQQGLAPFTEMIDEFYRAWLSRQERGVYMTRHEWLRQRLGADGEPQITVANAPGEVARGEGDEPLYPVNQRNRLIAWRLWARGITKAGYSAGDKPLQDAITQLLEDQQAESSRTLNTLQSIDARLDEWRKAP